MKKRLYMVLAVAAALNISGISAVYAGDPGVAFTDNQTLTHTRMNELNDAVSDNDGRVTTNTTNISANTAAIGLNTTHRNGDGSDHADVATNTTTISANTAAIGINSTAITNLQGGVPGSSCVGNNASDAMVRVGSICVDQNPASLWSDKTDAASAVTAIPGGCTVNGTGCSGIVAQSRATPGSALKDGATITWARAAIACANAGKRLLTGGEWMMARAAGVTILTSGNGEFVDSMYGRDSDATGSTLRVIGSPYIRNNASVSDYIQSGLTTPYNTLTESSIGFRCAR